MFRYGKMGALSFLFDILVPLFCGSSLFAAQSIAIEEGWRYTDSTSVVLKLQEKKLEYSFFEVHQEMAETLVEVPVDDNEITCLVRLRPVFIDKKGELAVGRVVSLTDNLSPRVRKRNKPQYEVGFKSGFCPEEGDYARSIDKVDIMLSNRTIKEVLGLCPANAHGKGGAKPSIGMGYSVALRFYQKFYMNPQLLKDNIQRKFPEEIPADNQRIFDDATRRKLATDHKKTVRRIESYELQLSEDLALIQQECTEHSVLYAFRDDRFKSKVKDMKAESKQFYQSSEFLSYNCAEQAAFDFFQDINVIKNLKELLRDAAEGNDLEALIVHIHCTQTPCSHCATSLTRETEDGGVLKTLSAGKVVVLLGSCSKHYQRPEKLISYKALLQFQEESSGAEEVWEYDLEECFSPRLYPIVLMAKNEEEQFVVDREKMKTIRSELRPPAETD